MLEAGEESQDANGFVIVHPRHAVAGAAMEARVRREQSKCNPTLVQIRWREAFKSADVVTPVAESAETK